MSREMYRISFNIERIVSPSCLGQVMDEAHKWGNIKEALVVKYNDESPCFGEHIHDAMKKHGWEQKPPLETGEVT